jgi:hypothetical protein
MLIYYTPSGILEEHTLAPKVSYITMMGKVHGPYAPDRIDQIDEFVGIPGPEGVKYINDG